MACGYLQLSADDFTTSKEKQLNSSGLGHCWSVRRSCAGAWCCLPSPGCMARAIWESQCKIQVLETFTPAQGDPVVTTFSIRILCAGSSSKAPLPVLGDCCLVQDGAFPVSSSDITLPHAQSIPHFSHHSSSKPNQLLCLLNNDLCKVHDPGDARKQFPSQN